VTNGGGRRRCQSWIEAFIEHTDNLETAPIFRKWIAISAIAAVLEQKVWLHTSAEMYPNLYIFLVGRAGIGKTRGIMAASRILHQVPDMFFAPTSMTMASLVDSMTESKRFLPRLPEAPFEYNTLYIMADELSAFMHEYETELIGGLTTFYDCVPYAQRRRGKDIHIKILHPQLNILCGTTPSNLIKFVPEIAWEQGFMSRTIMVYSNDNPMVDDFQAARKMSEHLVHDIKIINSIAGQFTTDPEYRSAIGNWRAGNEAPVPTHPKLLHYNTRRRTHLYKLSMVSSADRGDNLKLSLDDFNRALGWLREAEVLMPEIFRIGSPGADAKVMDEIHHFLIVACTNVEAISEHRLTRFASERIPMTAVKSAIEVMQASGRIRSVRVDPKTGLRMFAPVVDKSAT